MRPISPHDPRRRPRRVNRLLLVLAAVATMVLTSLNGLAPASAAAAPRASAKGAHCPLPDEQLNASDNPYNGSDSSRKLLYYNAFRMARFPCDYPKEFRTVLMYPDALVLLEGGKVSRTVRLDSSRTVQFEDVVKAIGDPTWMNENAGKGIVTMDTTFIQMAGTSLRVGGPKIQEIRMTTRPHVFFGGMNATVLFESVKVTSWDPTRDGPDVVPEDGRPFVLYGRGSRMDILNSEMSYLGSDRSGGGYGISWQNGNTTGSAINSTFDHNFFGGYTSGAKDVLFRNNVFRDNHDYGLDPHDFSKGLIIEGNQVYNNGKHGIIFSNYVTESVIRNNKVFNNAGNGIVLDKLSGRNRIENNTVENNHKDGIVLLDSGASTVVGNTVMGNRVGLRANLNQSRDIEVRDNTFTGNVSGVRVYGGARNVSLTHNTVSGSGKSSVSIDAAGTLIDQLTVVGGYSGITVKSQARLSNIDVSGVAVGIEIRGLAVADLENIKVDATEVGLRRDPSAQVESTSVSLNAPVPSSVTGPKETWHRLLPYIGVGCILLAVLLEVIRFMLSRILKHERTTVAPATVWNVA